MTDDRARILLDEHVSRVFERVLEERGYEVVHAKDQFGEHTVDEALLAWAGDHNVILCTNDVGDFEALHETVDHAGLLLYHDQDPPYEDPEGFASAVDEVVDQYGLGELENAVVDIDAWYDWLHGGGSSDDR